MLWQLIFGFYLAAAIGIIAWWRKALDVSGTIAAVIVGTIIFGLGGLGASVALVVFFTTGSILSGLPNRHPTLLPAERHGRNWRQILANGFVPVLMILLSRIIPESAHVWQLAYYGSVAASASDTWATEFGVRYGVKVRDLLIGEFIPSGLSGGVSVVGIAASILGSIAIAFCSTIQFGFEARAINIIAVAGIFGSLADSLLGSSLQAKYRSSEGIVSDRAGSEGSVLVSGLPIITNSVVNFVSSAIGAFICGLLL
ncbi:MAG TPA: DUF92 domain-containing protein [Candidatus Kapabacteria bacterium]|jgi:uncharacterized protein (TIGR00297 family)